MKYLLLALAIVLVGCGRMSNQEIINETKVCHDAGMEAQAIQNVLDYRVYQVNCLPKDGK